LPVNTTEKLFGYHLVLCAQYVFPSLFARTEGICPMPSMQLAGGRAFLRTAGELFLQKKELAKVRGQ
jgi:hypothetical protein